MPVEPDYSRVAGVHDPEAGDEDFVNTYPTSFLGNDKGRRSMFSRSYMWRRRISYGVTGTIFLLAGLALSYHFGSSRGHVGKLLIVFEVARHFVLGSGITIAWRHSLLYGFFLGPFSNLLLFNVDSGILYGKTFFS